LDARALRVIDKGESENESRLSAKDNAGGPKWSFALRPIRESFSKIDKIDFEAALQVFQNPRDLNDQPSKREIAW
jgi:hypothetical protein